MDEDEFARRFFEQDLSDLPTSESVQSSGAPKGRSRRHPVMMVAVILFSCGLIWMFQEDSAFWFLGQWRGEAAEGPVDIGDSMKWRRQFQKDRTFAPEELRHNRYIRVAGLTAFRTEAADSQQAFLKIAYLPIYVHLKNEKREKPTDHFVHLTVSGRLLDMRRTTQYRGVQRHYAEAFGLPMRDAFMLVAEEKPSEFWWSPLLQALFCAFILVNGVLLVRTLKEA